MHNCPLVFGLLLGLAGCGTAPALVASPEPTKQLAAPSVPAGVPARTEDKLLASVATALNGLNYMEGRITFLEYRDDGREEHGTAMFHFRRKPFAARVDIEESNRPLAGGSIALWNGGSTITVKRKGFPLAIPLPADNGLVTSARGYRLDQTDIFSMGKSLLAIGATVRYKGRRSVQNGERLMMEVKSSASPPGVTNELIGLDPVTFVPTYREMYAGNRLVHRGIGADLALNKRLADSLFKL